MDSHRHLPVWQDARNLVGNVYTLTRLLPREEAFVVIPQLRRAVWSVQNNIAEGNGSFGRKETSRFFRFAIRSLAEVDSMVVTIPDLYRVDTALVETIFADRARINGALFGLLRRPGR
jgi:four helix bundle protein